MVTTTTIPLLVLGLAQILAQLAPPALALTWAEMLPSPAVLELLGTRLRNTTMVTTALRALVSVHQPLALA